MSPLCGATARPGDPGGPGLVEYGRWEPSPTRSRARSPGESTAVDDCRKTLSRPFGPRRLPKKLVPTHGQILTRRLLDKERMATPAKERSPTRSRARSPGESTAV